MPITKVLLVVWVIGGKWDGPEITYSMPNMKTCLERLKEYKPKPKEVAMCEYRTDW